MAVLGIINKQPREKIDFDISYATVLAGRSDTIASTTVEVTPAGLTVPASAVLTGNVAKVVISAGTNAVTYTVTVLATTTAGLIYEDELHLIVEETV